MRLRSIWVPVGEETQEWRQRRSVGQAVAQLRRLLFATADISVSSVTSALVAYADHEWEIDRAHRRLESALLALVAREPIEDAVRDARQADDDWLDKCIRAFTSKLVFEGLTYGHPLRRATSIAKS